MGKSNPRLNLKHEVIRFLLKDSRVSHHLSSEIYSVLLRVISLRSVVHLTLLFGSSTLFLFIASVRMKIYLPCA